MQCSIRTLQYGNQLESNLLSNKYQSNTHNKQALTPAATRQKRYTSWWRRDPDTRTVCWGSLMSLVICNDNDPVICCVLMSLIGSGSQAHNAGMSDVSYGCLLLGACQFSNLSKRLSFVWDRVVSGWPPQVDFLPCIVKWKGVSAAVWIHRLNGHARQLLIGSAQEQDVASIAAACTAYAHITWSDIIPVMLYNICHNLMCLRAFLM